MMNFRRERVELRIMQMKVDGLEDVMIIDKRERERDRQEMMIQSRDRAT